MKPQRSFWLLILLTLAALPAPAQDTRVRQLELDVAQLRRELLAQTRRISELERQTQRDVQDSTLPAPLASPTLLPWLVAANWERIRAGMAEAEAVQVLGTPTSIRTDGSAPRKLLLYALEVAPAAYLAASVEIVEGRVTEVRKPTLR